MSNELLEKVGALTAKIGEVKDLALPKGEAEERFKKIEKDLGKVTTALREETKRPTSSLERGDLDVAADYFVKHGFKSLPRETLTGKSVKARAENAATIKGVSIYKTDPFTMQTTAERAVPEEVVSVLEMMDHLYIIDSIFTIKHRDAWAREKANHEGGARGLFLEKFPEIATPYDAFVKSFFEMQGKALDSTTPGKGDEWVPTLMATNLLDIVRLAMPVTNLIPHQFQPSNPWQNPVLTAVPTAKRKLENTPTTGTDLVTGVATWTAHTFTTYSAYSDEVAEDSAIAIAPTVRSAIIRAMGEGLEMALVNGDGDAAGHFDNDYQYSSGDYETYQGGVYGLRHFALDDDGGTPSTVDGGGDFLSYADIGAALAEMGKFGGGKVASGEIAALVNAESYVKLVTEDGSPIQTVDKYGPQATILTGEVGRVFGIPVFISFGIEERRNSVNAVGQSTGVSDTLSTALLFNRLNWRIGDRRDFRIETDKDIVAGRNDMVATARWSMQSIEGDNEAAAWDPSTVPAVVAIRNID